MLPLFNVSDLYYCVYHSVIHITMTCSTAKDNIYFVIIFIQFAIKSIEYP